MGRKRNNSELKAQKIGEEKITEPVPPLSNEEIEEHDRLDREYFDKLPTGYRFTPTPEELIDYLKKKASKSSDMPLNRIRDCNIYRLCPQDLTSRYKLHREKEWYFFSSRTKKYLNGKRPDRKAGNGFWKASGVDVDIADDEGIKIGTRKSLVYYEGNPKNKNATKTNWIMHEYIHEANNTDGAASPVVERRPETNAENMKLNDVVLCKIYYKDSKEPVPNQNPNVVDVDNAANSPRPSSFPTSTSSHMPTGSTFHTSPPMTSSFPLHARSPAQNQQVSNPNTRRVIDPANDGHLPNQNTNGLGFDNIAAIFQLQNVSNPNTSHDPRQADNKVMNVHTSIRQVPNQKQNGIFYGNSVSYRPLQHDHMKNPNSESGPSGACFQNGFTIVPMPAHFHMHVSSPRQASFPLNHQVPNADTRRGTDLGYRRNTVRFEEQISMPNPIQHDDDTSMPNPIQSLSHGQSLLPTNLQATEMRNNMDFDFDFDFEDPLSLDTHSQFAQQESTDELQGILNEYCMVEPDEDQGFLDDSKETRGG